MEIYVVRCVVDGVLTRNEYITEKEQLARIHECNMKGYEIVDYFRGILGDGEVVRVS